jgi:Domain of unknown function (DUF1844)
MLEALAVEPERETMPEEKEEDRGFKVVDRRMFATDGKPREEVRREERPVEVPPPAAKPQSRPASPAREAKAGEFDMLVSYLYTTAMFQMGLLPGPSGERIPADLPNARRTIALIEVLQSKTTGNLTDEESKTLEDALYELRMGFVEIQKHLAKKK